MCLDSLFDQRKKINDEWKKKENEWDDDEHEQKRAFREEEERNDLHSEKRQQPQQQPQLKCEMTNKAKTPGSIDCDCKRMCMARKSETQLIYYEGGIGTIPKK